MHTLGQTPRGIVHASRVHSGRGVRAIRAGLPSSQRIGGQEGGFSTVRLERPDLYLGAKGLVRVSVTDAGFVDRMARGGEFTPPVGVAEIPEQSGLPVSVVFLLRVLRLRPPF